MPEKIFGRMGLNSRFLEKKNTEISAIRKF